MFWWWKLQFNSPDGATRKRAIDELIALLEDGSQDRQRKAAELLATIAHPLAVQWALQSVTKRDCAEWSASLLEQIMTELPHVVEAESLLCIAELGDPLQAISAPAVSMGGRQLPSSWQNYRSVNCSALREKAQAELQRRAEAEARWQAADEEQKRQAAPSLAHRRTA